MAGLTTCKRINTILDSLRAEGWTTESGKHLKLRAPNGRLVVVSRTPSDRRAELNIITTIRRAQRASGNADREPK